MHRITRAIQISKIVIILALIGAVIPAASAVFDDYPPCCPIYADYPDYYYPVDPYYTFPAYCVCPFLDDALNRSIWKDTPAYYWEWVISSGSGNSSCTTCSGSSSTYTSFSYSNANFIYPEKDTLLAEYDKISISTTIKLKDQVLSKYLK